MKKELNRMTLMYKNGIYTNMYAIPKYTIQGVCEGYEILVKLCRRTIIISTS